MFSFGGGGGWICSVKVICLDVKVGDFSSRLGGEWMGGGVGGFMSRWDAFF